MLVLPAPLLPTIKFKNGFGLSETDSKFLKFSIFMLLIFNEIRRLCKSLVEFGAFFEGVLSREFLEIIHFQPYRGLLQL